MCISCNKKCYYSYFDCSYCKSQTIYIYIYLLFRMMSLFLGNIWRYSSNVTVEFVYSGTHGTRQVLDYELFQIIRQYLYWPKFLRVIFFNILHLRFLLDNKNHCIFIQTQFIYSVPTQQHVLAKWTMIRLAKLEDKYTVYFCLPYLPTWW